MQGCTEPSSTLQPYALAIQAHNITDPIGANANARIRKSASRYQTHGKRFRRGEGGGFISTSSNLLATDGHSWNTDTRNVRRYADAVATSLLATPKLIGAGAPSHIRSTDGGRECVHGTRRDCSRREALI